MFKKIIKISLIIFFYLVFSRSVQATTIYDANASSCTGPLIDCFPDFNHLIFGNVTIDDQHNILFSGKWVRINYLTHLNSAPINVSYDVPIVEGTAYETSINTSTGVYNSNISTRITVVEGNMVELLAYKMDQFGNNYLNLKDDPPGEYISVKIGNFDSGSYYHFQTIYDGTTLSVYFDHSLVFTKQIAFVNNYYNVAFMSNSSQVWKNILVTDDPQNPTPINIDPTATPTLIPTATTTPTPTLTPTPTGIPTPIPRKTKIVLIPGAFASWNKEAILHKKTVDQSEWHLLPFINEYRAIIETLKNLGYKESEDFYVFAYDWRKPLDKIADDLNSFINQHSINSNNFYVIGHSLGGLAARIYKQKYNDEKLNKVVTSGSPHQGAVQTYKAVEAGELEEDNSWLWLSQKLILQIYRDGLKTDRQILNENFPVAHDLLPTFPYLKNSDEIFTDISLMSTKNSYLIDKNIEIDSILDSLKTLSGININTINGYKITGRTPLDKLLGNYVDGRPLETSYSTGDGVVLALSSSIATNTKALENHNHGDIIYKKTAIEEILNYLDISYSNEQVNEGSGTILSPSLLFLIKSPAAMEVSHNGNAYHEHDGIIFIENAISGQYKLTVKGKERGKYEVIVGEIGTNGNSWNSISGEITSLIPQFETDIYNIQFRQDNPDKNFIDQKDPIKLIDELILLLMQKEKINKEIIKDFIKVKSYFVKKNIDKIAKILFDQNEDLIRKNEFLELEKLENIYSLLVKFDIKKLKTLNDRFNSLLKDFNKKQIKLLKQKKIDQRVTFIIEQTNKKLMLIQSSLIEKNYSYSEILLESVSNLLKKI